MAEAFVPLFIDSEKNRDTTFFSIHTRPPTSSGAGGNNNSLEVIQSPAPSSATATSTAQACTGKPKVTLQRDGESVSSIRIECGCGQVIELACAY